MASIKYLIRNRAHFSIFSILFYRAWAKRILCLHGLLNNNWRRFIMVKQGATINPAAEIGKVTAPGNKRNLCVGANSFLGRVHIALHEKVIIGENVCINDGVQLLTATHNTNDPLWSHVKKEIIIEDYVWIATNAIVLPGVTIGKGAVIGAGAVVTKSVVSGDIVAGNPAKSIGKKRSEKLIYNPCEFLAPNRAWLKG